MVWGRLEEDNHYSAQMVHGTCYINCDIIGNCQRPLSYSTGVLVLEICIELLILTALLSVPKLIMSNSVPASKECCAKSAFVRRNLLQGAQ